MQLELLGTNGRLKTSMLRIRRRNMKGDTRILDLFLLFRMSKEEIIGLINEKQPVVFVSGEHAYMVRDYRCDMTEQTPRMLGGFMDWNIERSYEECSPIGEVKIVLEEVFVLRKNRNVKSRTIEVKIQ